MLIYLCRGSAVIDAFLSMDANRRRATCGCGKSRCYPVFKESMEG